MKKNILLVAVIMLALPMVAQETYENANITTEDLNGTARYVAMGGAMDALGADISTIGTNPAGIGLFRKSQVNASFGLISQDDVASSNFTNKTNVSFDQIGFVYTTRTNSTSYLNFAFNYHKSRNFNQIISAVGSLDGASQNKLSYIKGWYDTSKEYDRGKCFDISENKYGYFEGNSDAFSQVDYLHYNTTLYDDNDGDFKYSDCDSYFINRSSNGYIGEYDFNISGNINNKIYLGLTLGIHDVHYNSYVDYTEENSKTSFKSRLIDERKITGIGYDIKAGIIVRPIEESAFRFGLSVASPIFYDLESTNYTTLGSTYGNLDISESYEFRMNTPWKFGLSLGHTIGSMLALGAGYEYSDYSSIDNRYKDGGYQDAYGDWYDTSSSDVIMNGDTKANLKGVHTLKVGTEYKLMSDLAIRLGYNYASAAYKNDAFRDQSLDCQGVYYSSTTDYTNWKDTHRITCGFGYQKDNFSIDLAYQFSTTNGEHYPFMSYYADVEYGEPVENNNIVDMVKVSNKRHQLLLTLSYRF